MGTRRPTARRPARRGSRPLAGRRRSVRDLPAAERPRERLALRGPGGLSAAELIAVVLGTGARRPGRDRGRGGRRSPGTRACAALARATDARARRDPGRRRREGGAARGRVRAGTAVGRGAGRRGAGRSGRRATSRTACCVEMGRLEREELRVLSLNAKNVVQRVSTVYVGNVSASLVRVGELFRDAVRLDASGIVLSTTTRPATRRRAPTTSTSPPRRSPPGGCSTSTSSTTW